MTALRSFPLTMLALLTLTAGALAMPEDARTGAMPLRPGEIPDHLLISSQVQATGARVDTTWFGGDDGAGRAVEDGLWDFQSPGSNGFQGWRSEDLTYNPGDYFARVTEADFLLHGDPCVPIQPSNLGMLWCGIHEDEADQRDFVAGMGYQNMMCQRALSPEWAIDPLTEAIDLSFLYFNNTEPGFDFTYVELICRDAVGDLLEAYPVVTFEDVIGDPAALAQFGGGAGQLPPGTLDPATATIQLELRVECDGAWSDQDGLYPTPCGPFGLDDLAIAIGGTPHEFDFETGPQGWTFERCEGVGAFMALHDEAVWSEWVDALGILCECPLMGRVLGFIDTESSPYDPPGMAPGQKEAAESGIVVREYHGPPEQTATIVEFDAFVNMPYDVGAHYRPGWMIYPYTTEPNPVPHWSDRHGQEMWYYTSSPYCARNRVNLTTMDDEPLPAEWDSLRFVYEVYCSCEAFGTPPSVCTEEGDTGGAPLLDHVRVGLTSAEQGPHIVVFDMGLYMDGYGQNYPTYLEPSDRCNSNIAFDLSMSYSEKNDWHADSSGVTGMLVTSEATRWLAELCFRIPRTGARQSMIPEYHAWKARLPSDPEDEWVCVLMDSLETNGGAQVWNHKFATYFHEEHGGFDAAHPDFSEAQEILPDGVFVPGTRIEYYFRAYWYNGGMPPTEFSSLPVWEYELLPTMTLVAPGSYAVEWPCVLYVDGFNRGSEGYIMTVLDELGYSFDKFDYQGTSSCCNAPLKRSYGGTGYNPGGYGNNGLTTEQLLGYRVVWFNVGYFGLGCTEPEDWELLEEWLSNTTCGVGDIRRGLILDGDQIAEIGAHPTQGYATAFVNDVLGVDFLHHSYREYNDDEAYCVYLEPGQDAHFEPDAPGLGVFGSGCPNERDCNVLGVFAGVPDVVGNLRYYSYEGTGIHAYVDFAQVVRQNTSPGVANWRTVVNGFSTHGITERGCGGEDCSPDSTCRVQGGLDLASPLFGWMEDPGDPFEPWRYPCVDSRVEEQPETHLSGPVTHLFAGRPNPFHRSATLRFRLAQPGNAALEIYDVGGRRVRTLVDRTLSGGEHTVVWDGLDQEGHQVGGGIYWVRLRTEDGYRSSRRILVMR